MVHLVKQLNRNTWVLSKQATPASHFATVTRRGGQVSATIAPGHPLCREELSALDTIMRDIEMGT